MNNKTLIMRFSLTSIIFVVILGTFLLIESVSGSKVNSITDSNIVGSYLVNNPSKTYVKVNTFPFTGSESLKIKSVTKTNKELRGTDIPILSSLTRDEVSEVDSIRIKSLPGDYYYISDISTIFNEDGTVSSKVSLDKLPYRTLNSLGLKPAKTVIYNTSVGLAKRGDKVLLSKDGKLVTPTKSVKEKEIVYKVPKHTFYKYVKNSEMSINTFWLIICIWVFANGILILLYPQK